MRSKVGLLFRAAPFTSHGGEELTWKIECDGLTEGDWEAMALIYMESRPPAFGDVWGVPRGGLPLARALRRYVTTGPRLIVDDVLTTGGSILGAMREHDRGLVAFSRARALPARVSAIFQAGLSHAW